MKRHKFVRLAICAVAACLLFYFFPLVRVTKLGSTSKPDTALTAQANSDRSSSNGTAPGSISTFIESLWREQLPKAAESAESLDEVLTVAAMDFELARIEFGREVGMGGPTYFFLRGRGRIENVDDNECRVIIDGQEKTVSLEVGILLGNAIRDATGLVSVDEFPNSQEFNRLSTELNQRCELHVINPVRELLTVGALVEFVGCGEVRTRDDFEPLRLVPVQLRVVESGESTE